MAGKNFAFETDEVSIAFYSIAGLGNAVIARKVFDAIVELAPACVVDIFCTDKAHENYAKAFYGDEKNFNRTLNRDEYLANLNKYDLALYVGGCHAIFFQQINPERLNALAPNLLHALAGIENYNKRFVYGLGEWKLTVALRNMIAAQVIGENWSHFLAYDGALPIRDDKINIPLNPDFKPQFDALKLGKYITIYTNIPEREKDRPKVKAWPVRYQREFVARMKKRLPQIEIVQLGGGDDVKVENADRHILGCDLELTKYILANSLLHVGGEGGLVHLATAVGTKCLVLFGSSGVDYYGYAQNINLVSEVCRPCMYVVPDFNICMLGAKEPPCMLSHTPQNVCEITCNYLKRLDT